MIMTKQIVNRAPLGYRLCNPCNIRYSSRSNWLGQVGQKKGFAKFSSFVYGWRAALLLIRNYIIHGYDTIPKIISRWAPPSENHTEVYINTVVSGLLDSADGALFGSDDDSVKACRITQVSQVKALLWQMSLVEIGKRFVLLTPIVKEELENALDDAIYRVTDASFGIRFFECADIKC